MTWKTSVQTENPYVVTVGRDLTASLVENFPDDASQVLIVHSAPLTGRVHALTQALKDAGRTVVTAEVPDAELGKTAEVAAFCWKVLGQSNFTRTDVVMGVGGGAVTDLAGFVAASWLRGVRCIQVPTTVLAMVDAAVGGKTGINTAEGKNLVGAFHEPVSVWCDVTYLETLPRNDVVAGLAEVVKAGFISNPEILEIVREATPLLASNTSSPERDSSGDSSVLPVEAIDALLPALHKAIEVKAAVVATDFRESYAREILNYGHTLGHAIEYVERYSWRHGAAVSVGMVFAAELSFLHGKLGEEEVAAHRDILTALGLPVSYPSGRWDQLYEAMQRDKKTRGATLRFVVLDAIGRPSRVEGPDPALLTAAYATVSN